MNKVFIFVLGAASGSLLTWKLVEGKYRRIADKEVEDVVEYYRSKEEAKCVAAEENEIETNVDDNCPRRSGKYPYGLGRELTDEEIELLKSREEYKEQISDLGYADVEEDECIVVTPQAIEYIAPYVIEPEEFGEEPGFKTETLIYYADGILTDEEDNIVFEPEAYIGDGIEHFGEYDDESVYVRNDNLKIDYEILKHENTYKEIMGEDNK